jgi:hypothetical protein
MLRIIILFSREHDAQDRARLLLRIPYTLFGALLNVGVSPETESDSDYDRDDNEL